MRQVQVYFLLLVLGVGAVHNAYAAFGDALIDAADTADTKRVVLLLETGHPVDNRDSFGTTPLMRAALKGHLNIVKMLMNNGADVNARDLSGMTALHMAAQNGHTDSVKALLKAGASLNILDNERRTAIMLAKRNNDEVTTGLLSQALQGATRSVPSLSRHGSPINITVSTGAKGDIIPLPVFKADSDREDHDPSTELEYENPVTLIQKNAAKTLGLKSPVPLKQLYISNGFSFEDPLVDASERGDLDEAIRLLQEGHPSYISGLYGVTPLMRASYRGYLTIVQTLLSFGADVNAVDRQGVTALRMALEGRQNAIANFLIENGATVGRVNDRGLYFEDGTDIYYSLIGTDAEGCDMYVINSLKGMVPSSVVYRASGGFTINKMHSNCKNQSSKGV